MAAGFDLTGTARSLLNIEANTIVRDNTTAEPMPRCRTPCLTSPEIMRARWILSGLATAAIGILFRWVLRMWLRWKFHRGLAMGR
jgi:hypothetical protein